MGPTFYIFSTRMQGWVLRSGAYGTDLSQAKVYSYDEAVKHCTNHTDHNGAMIQFPVATDMVAAISAGTHS